VRRTFAWAGASALIILGVVLFILLATRGSEAPGGPTTSVSRGPVVTSPYDFTEATPTVDFNRFGDAKFISLTLKTPAGVRSYLLARDSAGFVTLIAALASAQQTVVPVSPPGQTTLSEPAVGPSLTVVMADRTTYTFALDLKSNVLVRGTQVWRLQGDLKTLVESVTAR
jgi:hypothetical protein